MSVAGSLRAAQLLRIAVKSGAIPKPLACEQCTTEQWMGPHGHHDDYNMPLTVRWLCHACHRAWHRKHTAIAVTTNPLEQITMIKMQASEAEANELNERAAAAGISRSNYLRRLANMPPFVSGRREPIPMGRPAKVSAKEAKL